MSMPAWYGRTVGWLALAAGVMILIRDLLEVHSLGYGLAGAALVGFGAWRLQLASRNRPR